MNVTKLALCLAALLWVVGLPAIAASAGAVALISAALELAAIRVAREGVVVPAQAVAEPTTRRASPRGTGAEAPPPSMVEGAPAPRLLDSHSMDDELALDDTPVEHNPQPNKAPAPQPALNQSAAVAVATVAIAPGMLDSLAGSPAAAPAPEVSGQTQTPFAGGAADSAAVQPAAPAGVGSAAAAMAEEGWASEPPGGY